MTGRDSGATRDRDAAGRARNARPRDASGRPLPRGATGVAPAVPDDLVVSPAQALAMAQAFLDDGRPFPAHEVLEAMWKQCVPGERELWRGLAQLAVGLTHVQRGNAAGATALLTRGADRLVAYTSAPPHAIDVEGLVAAARALAQHPTAQHPTAQHPTDRDPTARDPAARYPSLPPLVRP